MTIAHRPDAATAEAQLRRLANEASVLIGLRGSGDAWDWIVVLRIRRLLDRSIDVLAQLAEPLPDADRVGRRMRATRAEVDAHLRAADHLLAAGASAEKHADLLEQAVRLLVAEAGEPKRRRQRR